MHYASQNGDTEAIRELCTYAERLESSTRGAQTARYQLLKRDHLGKLASDYARTPELASLLSVTNGV